MENLSATYSSLMRFFEYQLIATTSLSITLGNVLLGLLTLVIGWRVIKFLIRRLNNRVLQSRINDDSTRTWFNSFLSFISLIVLMVFTLRIIGIPFSIFGKMWTFTLFTVQDNVITIGNIVFGLILLYPGFRFSVYLSREFNSIFLSQLKLDVASKKTIETVVRYLLLVIVVLFVLTIVGIPLNAFTLIGGAAAIGIGLGSQNLVNNFLSGLVLMTERPLKVNDIVEVEGRRGTVEHIGGRSTRIKTFDNVRMVIPNSKLLENTVINWSLIDNFLRREITIGVAYGSPVDQVRDLLLQALVDNKDIEAGPEPLILFTDFGDNALIFRLLFWVKMTSEINPIVVESDVRFEMNRLLSEAGIEISFPQRDVHLDTLKPLEIKLTDQRK